MDTLRFKEIPVLHFVLLIGGIIHIWAAIVNGPSARPYACETSEYCSVCCNCKANICKGDCKDGYHGDRCKNACPANCITCKDHSDTVNYQGFANCTQCKNNYYVTSELYQCQQQCPSYCEVCSSSKYCSKCKPGYYGDTCENVCPIGCLDNKCDKETGFCESCTENLNGSKCDACVTGKFGPSCSSNCNENCQEQVCKMTSGDCFSCILGKYGQNCDLNCPGNCLDESCNMVSGECMSCKNGHFGEHCNHFCPKDCNESICFQLDGSCESCKRPYFGTSCNNTCPERCLNDVCDMLNGSCLEGCEDNFEGHDCRACRPGWYDVDCKTSCSKGCLNENCDPSSGQCEDCKENFNGPFCSECKIGMTGVSCNQSCSKSCLANQCDRFYANCTMGCIENFDGPFCNQCMEGKYEIYNNCSRNCSTKCQNGTCNMTDGVCYGCKGNFSGDFCDGCVSGIFGFNCNLSCPPNCLNNTCDKETGSCLWCADGFNGTNCTDCVPGIYGTGCNETCSENCVDAMCDQFNGSCLQGCIDNFLGDSCNNCEPGLYGYNCSNRCSDKCGNETCNMSDGHCESCNGNFTGDFCELCVTGLYGLDCMNVCPNNCMNNSCNQTTGFCDSCQLNFYGQSCNNSCLDTCHDGTCHRTEGICSQECLEGFSGETCNEILKASSSANSGSLSPLQISIVGVSAVLGLLLFVILTSWVLHKKRLSKHEVRIEDSVNLMPNESNNDVAPVVEKSEPRMAHDYVNVVLDQTGYEQLDDASNQDRPSDIDVQANGRINENLEVNGNINIRSVGNDRISASKAPSRKSSSSSAQMVTLSETERSDTLTAESKATMSQIEPIAGSKPLSSLTTRESEASVTIMAKEYAANVLNAKQSKSAALDNIQMRFSDQNELQFRKKTFRKREIKSQNLELRDRSRKPNPPQTNLVKDQNLRAFSALYTNHTQRNDGSISLAGLAEYVRSRDEDFYQEEFGKFPKGLLKSYNDATKPENMGKNRYNGIYPYDETRVKLERPGSDYINASFVNGYKKKRQFIAALGPIKKATENFKTFWLMIWQQKVEKIVMVTNLREQGSMKCEKYWPDKGDSNMYGQVKVACTNIQEYSEFVIRTFIIEKDRECHLLLHYHFTAWPDKAAPEEVTSIIDLRHIVNATKPIWKGPVVVHCSAGIGRTGTYIALDYLTEQGRAEGYLDVFRCVCDLRQQRTSMVQKWEQYRYIHQALVQSLLLDSDPVALEGFRDYAADEQRLAMVFKRQDLLIETPDDEEKEALTRNESLVHLNREGADIPGDLHRVRLYLHRSHGDCDYINAVYVDSFLKKNQYIIAQTPLRATVKDFLMMVVQERCSCIVSLEDTRPNQNVGIFVPRDNKSRLSITPELGVSCSDVIETDAYVKKVLTISTSLNTGSSIHTVSHFRFKGWKDSDVAPSRVTEFIELVEDVADTVQEGDGPIIVHCLNGGGRSGLFCLVSTLLEKLDTVREISVVNAIRRVRYRRPVGIQSLEQFLFCYRALTEYLRITAKTASMSFDSTAEEPLSKISRQSRIILAGNMAAMLDEPDEHVYGNLTF